MKYLKYFENTNIDWNWEEEEFNNDYYNYVSDYKDDGEIKSKKIIYIRTNNDNKNDFIKKIESMGFELIDDDSYSYYSYIVLWDDMKYSIIDNNHYFNNIAENTTTVNYNDIKKLF